LNFFSIAPVTGPSSSECTYEGLVPRYEEGTKGSEPENGGGILKRESIWDGELGLQYLASVLLAIV